MMSTKMATIRYFEIRYYSVIISVYDVTCNLLCYQKSIATEPIVVDCYKKVYHTNADRS